MPLGKRKHGKGVRVRKWIILPFTGDHMTIHNKRIKEGYMLSRIQKKYTIINSLHVYTHIYESNSQYNGTKTSIITETKIKT